MRKRFYGALVLGSFLLAGGVVTSCSDYDDDINIHIPEHTRSLSGNL